ncbi:hypothetical protein AVEN_203192-1 [Araneus ventricosus]|uniref:Uncharacterized protein n=1 Tax=Araneus ventricosus TaxID=182803 RepID=A0A4Y2CK16_ARAVE|nr:hypothetical protein AVEN_203192-1 [Araneus ventricosus]
MAHIICCTTTVAHTSLRWVGLCCSLSLSDGNGKGTPINTLTNSARAAELHLFSILHGRIKFYLPSHGKVRDENAKVREAATVTIDDSRILKPSALLRMRQAEWISKNRGEVKNGRGYIYILLSMHLT